MLHLSRIDEARDNGCLHCSSRDLKDNGNIVTCNSCGCVHSEHEYSYKVSLHKKSKKKRSWFEQEDTLPIM